MLIAFDVDGCLFGYDNKPRPEVCALLEALAHDGNQIIVWSGGGEEYARQRVRELEIAKYVSKCLFKMKILGVDIAFDDKDVKLGKHNIKI